MKNLVNDLINSFQIKGVIFLRHFLEGSDNEAWILELE